MDSAKKFIQLFDEWEQKYKDTNDSNKFVRDGIVDEKAWNTLEAGKKILFILKEPNDEQHEKDGKMDLAYSLKDNYIKNLRRYATWRNVFLWSIGILNTEVNMIINFNEIYKKLETGNLNHIAVLNLKKVYGTSTANMSKIKKAAEDDRKYILKEIKLINPDIIVTANIMNILKTLIPEGQLIESFKLNQYDDWISEWNIGDKSICIIKHYHPQYMRFTDEKKYNDCCLSYQQYLLKKQLI